MPFWMPISKITTTSTRPNPQHCVKCIAMSYNNMDTLLKKKTGSATELAREVRRPLPTLWVVSAFALVSRGGSSMLIQLNT